MVRRRSELGGLDAVIRDELRQLREALARASQDAVRGPLMKRGALGAGEGGVRDVADQVMSKPVATRPDGEALLHERLLRQRGEGLCR